MNNRRSSIFVSIFVVLALVGFYAVMKGRPAGKPVITQTSLHTETGVPVEVASPIRKTVQDALSVTGQLAAESTTTLSTKVPGKVLFVAAQEGDNVAAGQLLIQLDDSDAVSQLKAADAGLQQAQAGLLTAMARLSQAKTGRSVGDVQTETAVKSAEAGLASAKARFEMVSTGARKQERIQSQNAVASAKAALDKAQSDYDRYKSLADEGAVSASTLDGFKTALDVAKAQHNSAVQAASMVSEGSRSEDIRQAESAVQQAEEALRTARAAKMTNKSRREDVSAAMAGVASAQAQVASAKANVAIARQNVSNFKIFAPRAGAITTRAVEPGQYANPGQGLLTLVDLSTIYLQADVSEVDVQHVRPGMGVTVKADAVSSREWRGRVESVVASADAASRSFTAKVAVSNTDGALKPNMFARAEIVTGVVTDALLVPKEAVFERAGKTTLVRVVKGKAEILPVSTGISSGDDIVVRAAELSVKDNVVTSGQQDLSDGQKVKLPAKG